MNNVQSSEARVSSPTKRKRDLTALKAIIHKFQTRRDEGEASISLIHPKRRAIPLKERENAVSRLWTVFEAQQSARQLKSNDRNSYPIPACIGAPGVGKTRFLIEALEAPPKRLALKFPSNEQLFITFNNGNDLNKGEVLMGAERVLAIRLLYHHFAPASMKHIDSLIDKLDGITVTLRVALKLIRDDLHSRRHQNPEPFNLFIGIDEFNKVGTVEGLGEDEKKSFLKKLVEFMGQVIIKPPKKMDIYVLFAGTARERFNVAVAGSSFPLETITLPFLKPNSAIEIVEHQLPGTAVRTHARLMQTLLDFGGQPRALEHIITELKSNDQLPKFHSGRWTALTYGLAQEYQPSYPLELRVSLLKSMLTSASVEAGSPVIPSSVETYSTLEESGLITLEQRADRWTVGWPHGETLRLVAHHSSKHILIDMLGALTAYENGVSFQWQDFEVFSARHLSLLITAWAEETEMRQVSMDEMFHACIKSSPIGVRVTLPRLAMCPETEKSKFRYPKRGAKGANKLNHRVNGRVVANGEGAKFDFFAYLDTTDERGLIVCGQTKYYMHSEVTLKLMQEEYRKVEKALRRYKQHWVLLIITTGVFNGTEQDLPKGVLLVSQAEFEAYFTLNIANRLFFQCTKKIDLNRIQQDRLAERQGIGKKTAALIVKERDIKPFADVDDAVRRVKQLHLIRDDLYIL